jgi:hypothetical protein
MFMAVHSLVKNTYFAVQVDFTVLQCAFPHSILNKVITDQNQTTMLV